MSKVTVRMLMHVAGSGRDDELLPGKEYDLDEAFANRLVDREFAELAEPRPKRARRQTATREQRETAVMPAADRR